MSSVRAPDEPDAAASGPGPGPGPGPRDDLVRLTTVVADTRRCEGRARQETVSLRQMALVQERALVLHVHASAGRRDMLLITFAGLRIASAPVPRPLLVNFTNGPAARTQQGTAALAHALDDAVRTMPANSRLLAHLALALQALAGDGGAAQGPPASGLSDAQLRRALAFIEERFSEPLKLADMAAACALSPGHFARAFQASTDKTPYRWLLDRRIAEAQRLLAMTTTPLLQVALACGFASQSHFTRIFRNTTGTPPGVWRRSATTFG